MRYNGFFGGKRGDINYTNINTNMIRN